MDEHSLRVLEFEAVLRATASFCDTSLGQAQVLGLRPFQDKARLELELSRVAETGLYLTVEGGLDLTGLHDLTRFADRLETLGGFLDPEELDLFRQTLECLSRTRRRLTAKAQDYPLLAELGSGLADHQELIAELKRTFGPGLTIADAASPQLRRLRKRTGQLKAEIRRKLESLMADGQSQGLWQDEIVTQRNDRFVLPLKASRKGEIEGIIHDSSATRQTVYCEPLAVVGLNNQLGLMSAEERQEVIRILTRLTQRLGAIWPELSAQIEIGAHLDCLQARARLGQRLGAIRPEIDEGGRLELIEARHPLLILGGAEAVAVDLVFPPQKRLLIISGPNAGGKTVALKTLGLLGLMALSGLPIPAAESSRVPFLKRIAALIGDDQAISDGSSTFSARLSWFKEVLAQAGESSLILIDELGAGTDPAEGAALSLAVLDRLAEKEAKVMATTHLSFIKAYAAANPLALNLSVMFDPDSRRPTYEISYGQPGLSNAFEAASQAGLEEAVTSRARDYLGGEEEKFHSLLQDLNRQIEAHRQAKEELAGRQAELDQARAEVEEMKNDLAQERASLLEREGIRLKETLARTEEELREILEEARSKEARQRERARYRFFETKSSLTRALRPPGQDSSGPAPSGQLKAGQRVRLAGYNRPGVIERETKPGLEAEVRLAGGLKVKINPSKLTPLEDEPRPSSRTNHRPPVGPSRESFWPEVNIIGLRVEEALPVVDKALDEAILTGLARLSVIHGVGAGILRQAVREFLADHPQVKGFSAPEGVRGAGVTEVELGV
ncbi:MAG: Smr/MutS family protein [Deltaproteobacteria bacterium]|nr:Smr/MutS family protein [Deltaproteobacteria bacterium]